MADPQADMVKSPIIMKVDSPVEDKEKEENENNEKSELEMNPNQICSPTLTRSVLSAPRFGSTNPFAAPKTNFLLTNVASSKTLLRPSQLGQSSNKPFSLNPSKLNNPFAKKSEDNSTNKSTSSSNGETPKFMPLLVSTEKSNEVIKNNITPTQASSSFVFGQNLQERVVTDAGEEPKPSTSVSTNGTSNNDMLFSSAIKDTPAPECSTPSKSLTESAREYAEQRANKRKYEEVEVKTGEEDETNVLHLACKLFAYDKAVGNWQDRGRGNLRLNDQQIREENITYTQSRVVFRTSGVLKVILNTKIWAEMTIEQASAKSIRFTAIENTSGEIKVFLVMASQEEIKQLYKYLQDRLVNEQKRQNMKKVSKSEENSESSTSEN